MNRQRWIWLGVMLAGTVGAGLLPGDSMLRSLWPAAVAVLSIFVFRHAAAGLACGVLAAAGLLAGGNPIALLKVSLVDHGFPAVQGSWRVSALVFTLVLGSFAGILEASRGFDSILRKWIGGSKCPQKRLLGGVYGMGLLCFFDGLASSLLAGRIARPMADRAQISRERLAWVVDTTGSPVACVAFISTWIATQLSLIEQGLAAAPFDVSPYELFFQSVPANAYCLLSLAMVPLVIAIDYQPRWMRRYRAVAPESSEISPSSESGAWTVLLPIFALVMSIFAGFAMFSAGEIDIFSLAGWQRAFGGEAGPYALVFGSLVGWITAAICFPKVRRSELGQAAVHGAASLLPALVVSILAWILGSMFGALGTIDHVADLLGSGVSSGRLPMAVFLTAAAMSFTTGSSWATMGLLMPIALPAVVASATASGMSASEIQHLVPWVIGAVFGGATLGDHCSPFSDTTIVSALASGCRTQDHVISQLPMVGMVFVCCIIAYALMSLGLAPIIATLLSGIVLGGWLCILKAVQRRAM